MVKTGLRSNDPFCTVPQALGASFLGVVFAYAFQGLTPVLNNDDVRQVQSPEVVAMVTQGRWLYYFVFHKIFDQNLMPGFSTFVGSACLVGAAALHAKLIGLRHPTSVLVLAAVSSISIYYGYMFDFDSTRIAYPLGNLFSALGLVLVLRSEATRWRVAGVVLVGLAPALYPATLMYQVTLLVTAALYWCLDDGATVAWWRAVRGIGVVVTGAVLYRVSTLVLYALLGWELDERGNFNPLGLVDNWDAATGVFFRNAVPFVDPDRTSPYFSPAFCYLVLVIFVLFVVTVMLSNDGPGGRPSAAQLGLVIAGFLVLLISPFFLIAFTETDYYPVRSLYSFAAVYGALLAIAFERAAGPGARAALARWGPSVLLMVAAVFVFINASLVGQKSYDQSLAWQSDVAWVNRIIYRIDEVVADQPAESELGASSVQLPIVVVGDIHWRSGPRGDAVSAWLHTWSKEYIFRLIDDRFVPAAPEAQRRATAAAEGRQPWPAAGSVFVEDGVVIVVRS